MRITTGLSGTLLVLALAVAGCGGSDDDNGDTKKDTSAAKASDTSSPTASTDASADEPLDVCGLLTPADLQKAFGSPFDAGEGIHQDQTGADQCIWTNTDIPPIKTISVTVLRQGSIAGALKEGGVTVKSLHENSKAAFGDVQKLDLGDDAYLSGTTLSVLKGDTEYTFNTALGTSAQAINGMKTLAAQVVG